MTHTFWFNLRINIDIINTHAQKCTCLFYWKVFSVTLWVSLVSHWSGFRFYFSSNCLHCIMNDKFFQHQAWLKVRGDRYFSVFLLYLQLSAVTPCLPHWGDVSPCSVLSSRNRSLLLLTQFKGYNGVWASPFFYCSLSLGCDCIWASAIKTFLAFSFCMHKIELCTAEKC